MNELIWIGNTLYPRWFVFAVPVLVAIALIGGIVLLVKIATIWRRARYAARLYGWRDLGHSRYWILTGRMRP